MGFPLFPLHYVARHGGSASAALHVVLAIATFGSAAVFLLSLAAFYRRRSLSYLLIALAFAALVGREIIGELTMAYYLSPVAHHLCEHGLDIVMMLLFIGAVYYTRTVEKRNYDD